MEGRKISARRLLALVGRGEQSFRRTTVADADLRGAHLEGIDLWGSDLTGADLTGATLVDCSLQRCNLAGSCWVGAHLEGSNLWGANLTDARMNRVHVTGGDLSSATLTGAQLWGAHLQAVGLRGSDLRRADLSGAWLQHVDLEGIDIDGAILTGAALIDVELPPTGVASTQLGQITVDWRSVARSLHRPDLPEWLDQSGMPRVAATYLIDALQSMTDIDLSAMLRAVCLFHDPADGALVQRIRDHLTEHGIKNWVTASRFDRLILCCSRATLHRPEVQQQLDSMIQAFDVEGRGDVVLPIALDDVFAGGREAPSWWPAGRGTLYRTLRSRVVASFAATDDPAQFAEAAGKLIERLRG
ncbi:MAG: toll/interleukin-1 receptor domain-containing protein [Myxococcales bacterium]|nr:toll/interleukin-1 receptor domain-containing protein [Myxococcales bacterium]